jgi:hypothetical protein
MPIDSILTNVAWMAVLGWLYYRTGTLFYGVVIRMLFISVAS